MAEDYEYAKNVLEQLKNKYATKKNIAASNDNKNQPSTSKATADCQPSTSKTTAEKKTGKRKPKEDGNQVLPKRKSLSKFEGVITVIDPDISDNYGPTIIEKLKELQISYKIDGQICPNSISWRRGSDLENEEIEDVVIIMNWKEIVAFIKSSSFIDHVRSLQEILPKKKIFLGVYGMENYFSYWKSLKQGMSKATEKKFAEYKNSVKIFRADFEYALTEVQLISNCCYRLLNNPQDVSDLIHQFTKSLAQLPEKLENKEKLKNIDWLMLKDGRDCVQVDRNGNGLKRLWQQQLTTFELARLETAQAIISQYSTPSRLFQRYEESTEAEGRKLLEDVPIRRAAGPLTVSKKIGPELSNKLYTFFNSVIGDEIL